MHVSHLRKYESPGSMKGTLNPEPQCLEFPSAAQDLINAVDARSTGYR